MRHDFLPAMLKHRLFLLRNRRHPAPAPVAAGAQGVSEAAASTCLIARARGALSLTPRLLRATAGAIDLAAVAAAADQHPLTAAGAQKKPGGRRHCFGAAGRTWTKPAMGGILPPHACLARCGAWR